MKAKKKPEEPVPVLDNIESVISKDDEGNEVISWYLLRNPQFKHLNLCLNDVDDSLLEEVEDVLKRTPDDFGFTLSGNPVNRDGISKVHKQIEALHRHRTQELRLADPGSTFNENHDIGQKRLAF